MVRRQRSGSELLSVLRGHEAELRAHGVEALTVFGSVARGDATEGSDVDLAVQRSQPVGLIISASWMLCGIG
jgi:predicted nucleotidyltransferase